jgi:hypothetical protein
MRSIDTGLRHGVVPEPIQGEYRVTGSKEHPGSSDREFVKQVTAELMEPLLVKASP